MYYLLKKYYEGAPSPLREQHFRVVGVVVQPGPVTQTYPSGQCVMITHLYKLGERSRWIRPSTKEDLVLCTRGTRVLHRRRHARVRE